MHMSDDIAVVGIAYKLPQDVEDDAAFWDVLQSAKNLSGSWPAGRMNAESHPGLRNGQGNGSHSNGGHFIEDDPAGFDAPFFGLTAKEAASMDPVQRWTLEVSYRAFENAGIPFETLKGSRTAVLSATFTEDYIRMAAMDPDNVERTAATGCLASVIPNRVSYFFGMHGPSIHVDTACSSALSAFDMACKVIKCGDAEAALVTAANLILEPGMYQMFRNLQMLSPDSTCNAFDHKANGFGRGEGVLAFVLKPLSAALEHGDVIRAIVRGVASNQDGHTPALSQPNPVAQEQLIRHVYAQAGLGLENTRYVEAHGTGTAVGDPIEMRAIGSAFRDGRSTEEPLYVGSVKSNLGHLEGASGLAGILKAISILEHGVIPPNALFEKLNPAIDADLLRVQVPSECTPWPSSGLRCVSVNGFGFGGSNTHVILDDALYYLQERGLTGHHRTAMVPVLETKTNGFHAVQAREHPKLLVFSAFDEKAAKRTLDAYTLWYQASRIACKPEKLDALAYTLGSRRSNMRWRSFAISSSSRDEVDGKSTERLSPKKPIRVLSEHGLSWVFTGQGAQYVDMGWELIEAYPVFEETLRRINTIYRELGCLWSIFDELRRSETINKPEYSQPLSTAIQLALVELLKSFGITPKVVVGHSSGEIAAAYAVGALSLQSACKVSYFRGLVAAKVRDLSTLSPGSMVSINLSPDQVPVFLDKNIDQASHISIACINSPFNVTLSGPEIGINAVKTQADKEGVFARVLQTGVAYHSAAMRQVAEEYRALMGALESTDQSSTAIASTVTGKFIDPAQLATAQYWVDNMILPVQFSGAIKLMGSGSVDLGVTDVIEIGPHPALKRYVQDSLIKDQLQYFSALYRGHSAIETTLELGGNLFCRGYPVSLSTVNQQKDKSPFLVDCPSYPFDHSHKFWSESRISKDYRLRSPTHGDILGQRASDWNPLQPRWRNFLSVETHPWIGHHIVGDAVLFPATGMLIMAMEAAREMTSRDQTVTGYYVKDAQFMSPVVVPEDWDNRVEIMTCLRPERKPAHRSEGQGGSFDINLYTYSKQNHSWAETFYAKIQVQYSPVEQGDDQIADNAVHIHHKVATEASALPIDPQLLYSDAAEYGLQYGDWFQLCQDIRWDKSASRATARVPVSSTRFKTASIAHPAVLDTAFHVLRVSAGQQHSANVPVRLQDAWFSATRWQSSDTNSIQWLASSSANTKRGERGSISALGDNETVLARIGMIETSAVSHEEDRQKKLLYRIEWKPQLSLLSPEQLSQVCEADTCPRDETIMLAEHRKRTAVLNVVAVRHVKNIPRDQRPALNNTLQHHMDWMEHHVRKLPATEVEAAGALSEAHFQAQLDSFAASFPSWTLYPHVARSLPAIVAGDLDPLQVIFESDHAKTFYASLFHTVCGDGRLGRLVDLAAHENPSLRILEVGAGTGGMTVHILNSMKERERRTGAMAFAEYMYTDISPVFFESAKARWEAEGFGSRMVFKTLDMEQSVSSQGFAEGSYDLIVAGSCIHATKLLSQTLNNLRRLLKSGGRLVMLEVTDPTDIATCFFATLASGWWLSQEEWRVENKSPLASEEAWDKVLKENGFSGNDVVLRDTPEEEAHIVSVIVSTAVEVAEEKVQARRRRVFVVDPQEGGQRDIAKSLSSDQDVVLSLDDVSLTSIMSEDICVSLLEVDKPLLANISEPHFARLQELVRISRELIWVTASTDGLEDSQFPHFAIAQGFLRTVRAEMPDSHIVSLAFEDVCDNDTKAAFINKILDMPSANEPDTEVEYVVRCGLMHTARAVEDASSNDNLDSLLKPRLQEMTWRDSPAVKLAIHSPGSLDSLRFEQDEQYENEISPHEIEVEAQAWGFDERDVLAALGRLSSSDNDSLGSDCVGTVTRVGSESTIDLQPGYSVFMLERGCMRKFPRAHKSRVVKIPSNWRSQQLEEVASILKAAATAYHAVVDVARVAEDDKILILDAASPVGQMAVQIAKMQGAEIFATISTSPGNTQKEQIKVLCDTLGLAQDHVLSATSSQPTVKELTGGYGVDVILNTTSSDQRASCDLLASGGRFVDIGSAHKGTLLAGFSGTNASYAAVDVSDLRPKVAKSLLQKTIALVEDAKVSLATQSLIFPASKIQEAFIAAQKDKERAGVVVVPTHDDVSQHVFGQRQPWKLDNESSYLVPGGLGGVGRSILEWMVTRGAKHLIVPSRSGASSAAAAKLVYSLSSRGVNIRTPKCNIANEHELKGLLEEVKQDMPPIRGVINCAMVLTNAVFVNMSYQQWASAIQAKVNVSFNLHRLLPNQQTFDFFVHLASLAGVSGQMASANYAAGCTFQDALTRVYPATTVLDIGWMADVGLIAETATFQRQLKDWGNMQRVEERELLGILDMVCGNKSARLNQVLVGLRTRADYLAQGKQPPPGLVNRPLLSTFSEPLITKKEVNNEKFSSQAAAVINHAALFRAASDDKTRANIVASALAEKLARAMMMSADDVDTNKPLSTYGVDSLMAVELRNWIGREFGAKLGMWELMSGERVIKVIAESVVKKSSLRN